MYFNFVLRANNNVKHQVVIPAKLAISPEADQPRADASMSRNRRI